MVTRWPIIRDDGPWHPRLLYSATRGRSTAAHVDSSMPSGQGSSRARVRFVAPGGLDAAFCAAWASRSESAWSSRISSRVGATSMTTNVTSALCRARAKPRGEARRHRAPGARRPSGPMGSARQGGDGRRPPLASCTCSRGTARQPRLPRPEDARLRQVERECCRALARAVAAITGVSATDLVRLAYLYGKARAPFFASARAVALAPGRPGHPHVASSRAWPGPTQAGRGRSS